MLFRLFNARYPGRSVSFQSTSRWLGGRSIPEQDKLQVLAELFGVEPHHLRFGGGYRVAEKWLKDRKGRALSYDDLTHYQSVIAALARTLELQGEIDAAIECAGDWPLA